MPAVSGRPGNGGNSFCRRRNSPVFVQPSRKSCHGGAAENPSLWGRDFYMLHLSGGTNDFLHVSWPAGHMKMEELCSSSDISAGQYIDRIGVALGLPFPAGPALEELAEQADGRVYKVPVPHGLSGFSFAGPESQVRRDMRPEISRRPRLPRCNQFCGQGAGRGVQTHAAEKRASPDCGGRRHGKQVSPEGAGRTGRRIRLTPLFPPSGCSRDNATGNAFGAFMETGGGS